MANVAPPVLAPTVSGRPALLVGSLRITCLLRSTETGGAYSLFEIVTPPHDPGPPAHTHTMEDEAFFVLEGELTLVVGGQETHCAPGTWAFAPRNIPHGFRNDGAIPCRMLMIASPGGFENFFEACGIPAPPAGVLAEPPTEAQLQKIVDEMRRFGMTPHWN